MNDPCLNINKQTRLVYHGQHKRIVSNQQAMSRFLNMIQEDYFGLQDGYFKGKRILDAGCGDTAKLLIRFSQFGATDLTGLDLGADFIAVARDSLTRHGVPEDHVRLVTGNVDDLPFANGEFDFVCCHGVLLHLADMDQARQAFSELARVTRPGGHLYTVYGLYGGLWEAIYPAIRDHYRDNRAFRELIDHLQPSDFHALLDFIATTLRDRQGESIDVGGLKELIDTDLCVTIQNILQAPVRLQISPEWIAHAYGSHGFEAPRPLKRYVTRHNIRKYFAPLHYFREHPVSQLLYGSGNLEYIARKPG